MLTEKQKSLLQYIKNVPEWHSGLIYEQLAALNKAAAALSMAASNLERGFADGVLRPDRSYIADPDYQKDCRTEILGRPARELGQALAALEILGVLSDARSMDFQHDVRFLHDLTYIELEKLCVKHGYTTEEPQ